MRFSVIIPVYNVAPYLRACLDSVCAAVQELECRVGVGERTDHPSVEVICVDDGSTDGSGAILDGVVGEMSGRGTAELKSSVPFSNSNSSLQLKVIHQKNAGEGGARNAGLAAATGDWLCYLDADDLYARDMLKMGAELIDGHPKCDIVRVRWKCFEDGETPDLGGAASEPPRVIETDCRTAVNALLLDSGFSCAFYRRLKFADVRFPDRIVGEDRVYATTCLVRCDAVAVSEAVGYLYRRRPGSIVNSRMSARKAEDGFRHVAEILSVVRASGKRLTSGARRTLVAQILEGGQHDIRQVDARERQALWKTWGETVFALRRQKELTVWGGFIETLLRVLPVRLVAFVFCEVPYRLKKRGFHR